MQLSAVILQVLFRINDLYNCDKIVVVLRGALSRLISTNAQSAACHCIDVSVKDRVALLSPEMSWLISSRKLKNAHDTKKWMDRVNTSLNLHIRSIK